MKHGIIWEAWQKSTGEERCNFFVEACALYRPLVKQIIKKIEDKNIKSELGGKTA